VTKAWITQEREIEAREECARRGLDPDDYAADGILVWMVVDKEKIPSKPDRIPCPGCDGHECDDGCQYPGASKSDHGRCT
jgi:hypothetical protein